MAGRFIDLFLTPVDSYRYYLFSVCRVPLGQIKQQWKEVYVELLVTLKSAKDTIGSEQSTSIRFMAAIHVLISKC